MGRRSCGEYREAVFQVLSWGQRRILAPAAALEAPGEESLCHNLSSSIPYPYPGPCEIPSICGVSYSPLLSPGNATLPTCNRRERRPPGSRRSDPGSPRPAPRTRQPAPAAEGPTARLKSGLSPRASGGRPLPRGGTLRGPKASPSPRSEEHTSELQSRQYLPSFPTRRSSDLRVIVGSVVPRAHDVAIQEVLVQPHVLASQLPPPKVPQHA